MHKPITYGDYSNDTWSGLIDENDPLLVAWFQAIKVYIKDYDLWVFGGTLEPWLSYDLDLALTGPYDPKRINNILDHITRIGFEFGVLPDIKYHFNNELFIWSEYIKTGKSKIIKQAYYKPVIIWDGVPHNCATYQDGLYVSNRKYPMSKTLNKAHTYRDPIQLT